MQANKSVFHNRVPELRSCISLGVLAKPIDTVHQLMPSFMQNLNYLNVICHENIFRFRIKL